MFITFFPNLKWLRALVLPPLSRKNMRNLPKSPWRKSANPDGLKLGIWLEVHARAKRIRMHFWSTWAANDCRKEGKKLVQGFILHARGSGTSKGVGWYPKIPPFIMSVRFKQLHHCWYTHINLCTDPSCSLYLGIGFELICFIFALTALTGSPALPAELKRSPAVSASVLFKFVHAASRSA